MNLLLGANGAGKSTILEAIRLIESFVCQGATTTSLFPASSLCRWDTRNVQTFEIDLQDSQGVYNYRFEIEHGVERPGASRIKSEHLAHNKETLYTAEGGKGKLRQRLDVVLAGNRAGVGIVQDDSLISRFARQMRMVWSLQINPIKMLPKSARESFRPNADMSNFMAWYCHLLLDRTNRVYELTEILKNEVLDGFRSLQFKSVGERSRALWAEFGTKANNDGPEIITEYRFGELSDGQRALIALYALAICAVDDENTLCFDHPETHLALPEIQPWLIRLSDATDEGRCQAIIATHHPELINLLAAHSGYWLERQSGGPTRVRRISGDDSSGLPLSELIARGWLHG